MTHILTMTLSNQRDRLWTTDFASPMAPRSSNVSTVEYMMYDGDVSANFVVDFAPVLAFTEYTFDPSPFTNPTAFVQTSDLPTSGTSIHIDPAWFLAAWSADKDGIIYSNRTMTNALVEQMTVLFKNQTDGLGGANQELEYVALLPIYQTLSLVDHSTRFTTDTAQPVSVDHPLLQRYAKMNVWAYKMGSRTSYLGAVVGIMGCLVVITQVVLGFVDRRRYRSPTQLLVAALEHTPRGEFEGKGHDEMAMASVRFHIQDDGNHMGKFSFYEPVGSPAPEGEMQVIR